MMGVEPTYPAWKAGVIAVIQHPPDGRMLAQHPRWCQDHLGI